VAPAAEAAGVLAGTKPVEFKTFLAVFVSVVAVFTRELTALTVPITAAAAPKIFAMYYNPKL
jgi:hypothetical protein